METFVANGHSTGLDHAAEQRRDQGKRPARARRVGLRANRHNVLLTRPTEPAAGSTALRGGVDRAKAHNLSDCAATALHFNAHIGPWGCGDLDEHWEAASGQHMVWNGAFGALLFINDLEYPVI